jgi:hypothetical protein
MAPPCRLTSCVYLAAVVALALGAGIPLRAAGQQPSAARYMSEARERGAVAQQARPLLRRRAWGELEALAQHYRDPRSRFRSGRWKLAAFYAGFWPEEAEAKTPRDWPGLFADLEAWRAAMPRSVTALTAIGCANVSYAWEARGGGYAESVEGAGWRLFSERIHKARESLEAAELLGSRDPQTYAELLVVARAEGWNRQRRRRVLEKALGLAPGYHETYFEEAADLLPRWHGAPGDVERFAEQAVGYCKDEGEAIYARILWNVSGYYKDEERFKEHTFSWPRARRGFETLLRLYPDSRRNLNAFCQMACLAGDRVTAAELFDRIGENWTEDVWGREAKYLRWRRWAKTAR